MKPIQLWLPFMGPSLGFPEVQGDMQRALSAWNGEDGVWLLPWVDKPIRWEEENGLCFIAVPSETIDRIDIFHINQDGYVYGPGAALRFPNSRVDGLLDLWLNLRRDHLLKALGFVQDIVQIDHRISLRVPVFHGERVEYVLETFHQTPGPFFPRVQPNQGRFLCQWPPDGFPQTVFPDAEAYAFYKRQPLPKYSFHMCLLWPEPLCRLAPKGDSTDLLLHQIHMTQVVHESEHNHDIALSKAHILANPYIQSGWSTFVHSYYWPAYCSWMEKSGKAYFETVRQSRTVETPEEVFFLDETREQWKLTAEGLQEALDSGEWQAVLGKRVPIQRAWGIIGLFWSILLDQLEQGRSPTCGQCQRALQGRKQFCGPEDDMECYRKRLAMNRKRERHARNGKQSQ